MKRCSIAAAHATDPSKNNRPAATVKTTTPTVAAPEKKPAPAGKWMMDSWKSKKALQLPEYPRQEALDVVLDTIETFPPVVFAGEARHLKERLAEAAMGHAFILQGGGRPTHWVGGLRRSRELLFHFGGAREKKGGGVGGISRIYRGEGGEHRRGNLINLRRPLVC
jgi:hypothetical protein